MIHLINLPPLEKGGKGGFEIMGSNYIAGFYCYKSKMVILVDGGHHYSADEKEKDSLRDNYMTTTGKTVLSFLDREVLENTESVLEEIWRYL